MGAVRFRIIPNAPKTEFAGPYGDALKVKVSAPPVDGKANAELARFLSKKLGIPRGAVRIISGETSRDKLVEVEGFDAESLAGAL